MSTTTHPVNPDPEVPEQNPRQSPETGRAYIYPPVSELGNAKGEAKFKLFGVEVGFSGEGVGLALLLTILGPLLMVLCTASIGLPTAAIIGTAVVAGTAPTALIVVIHFLTRRQ